MKKGLLVAIYGAIDTKSHSKSIAWALSKKFLDKEHRKLSVELVNYPEESAQPSGQQIKDYLKDNPDKLTPVKFQWLNVTNKRQFEPKLLELLEKNDVVIAKMYTGTSIACGMVDGVDKSTLINYNAGLREPDLSIFLDSKNFHKSLEDGHVYKGSTEKIEQVRLTHLELASEFGWVVIDANRDILDVQEDLLDLVIEKIKGTVVPA